VKASKHKKIADHLMLKGIRQYMGVKDEIDFPTLRDSFFLEFPESRASIREDLTIAMGSFYKVNSPYLIFM